MKKETMLKIQSKHNIVMIIGFIIMIGSFVRVAISEFINPITIESIGNNIFLVLISSIIGGFLILFGSNLESLWLCPKHKIKFNNILYPNTTNIRCLECYKDVLKLKESILDEVKNERI